MALGDEVYDAAPRPPSPVSPYDNAEKIFPQGNDSNTDWLTNFASEDLLKPLQPGEYAGSADCEVKCDPELSVFALGGREAVTGGEIMLSGDNNEDTSLSEEANVEIDALGNVIGRPVDDAKEVLMGELQEMEDAIPCMSKGIDELLGEVPEEKKEDARKIVAEFKRKWCNLMEEGRADWEGVEGDSKRHRGQGKIQEALRVAHWREFVARCPAVKLLLESYLQVPGVNFNPNNIQYNGAIEQVVSKCADVSDLQSLARAAAAYEKEEKLRIAVRGKGEPHKGLRIFRKGILKALGSEWVVGKGSNMRMRDPSELPRR